MTTFTVKTMEKPRLSVKAQTLSALGAIAAAVILPQLFHAAGAVLGVGTSLGETFLPMHLPIILAGLLAGPFAGAIAGLVGPLVSSALSGMPGEMMLPFMMIELGAYGLGAGLLRNLKMPTLVKVLAVQIFGRVIRAAAILLAVYALGNTALSISTIWTSIGAGFSGLVLQWTLLPLLMYGIEKRNETES